MARSKGSKARSTPPRPAPPPSDSASSNHGDDDDDSDTFEDALPSTAQPSTPASAHEGDDDSGDLAPHAHNGEHHADIDQGKGPAAQGGQGLEEHGNEPAALNGAGEQHDDNGDAPSSPPADDLERAQTPTLPRDAATAPDSTPPRTPTSDRRTASRPSSVASTTSSSAGLDRREANRLSSSVPSSANELETDLSSPTDDVALEHEHHHHEGDDSVSELPSSTFSPAAKRPFSLSSNPETPTTPHTSSSPPASPARDRPKPDRRRSSLLASPFGAAPTDPTNVGRDGSASLTQAVWRQSLGLNSSPAARALVDVTLHDDEGDEDGRERALGLGASDDDEGAREGRSGATPRARRAGSSKRRSAAVNGDEAAAAGLGGYGALSHGAPPAETRDRQASVAEPHAADGFLSNRYSVNLSSLSASSPSVPGTSSSTGTAPDSPAPDAAATAAVQGEPETASNGIQRLQAEFLKVRERQEHEGDEAMAIDWDFWGRVMNDYEEVARTQRASRSPSLSALRRACLCPLVHVPRRVVRGGLDMPTRSRR